jgi:SNF2-related domain
MQWKYLVIDEAQRMKDRDSKLSKAFDKFSFEKRLLLTGKRFGDPKTKHIVLVACLELACITHVFLNALTTPKSQHGNLTDKRTTEAACKQSNSAPSEYKFER